MPPRKAAPPYTRSELNSLWEDAVRQSTPARRRASTALIALGAGAGLDGRWARKVRGTDVVGTGWVVCVRVGAPNARVIPVLAEWEDEILRLAEEACDDYLVGGATTHRNRTNDIITRFEDGNDHLKLASNRLRSTWIVTHLSMGTRLPELLSAAGTRRIETFDALLKYVSGLDESATARMLRGGT
jgi:hypothetical protein